MPLLGAIFDLDGTVVENAYDWPRIKAELGSGGRPVLPYLAGLPEPERSRKKAILEKHEEEQTRKAVLRSGIPGFLGYLKNMGVRTALVTNNSLRNVDFLLAKFGLEFDEVMARERGLWKPSGAPFLEVMRAWALSPGDLCVIGDTSFDVLAGREAGISRIFILRAEPGAFAGQEVEIFPSIEPLWERIESILGG